MTEELELTQEQFMLLPPYVQRDVLPRRLVNGETVLVLPVISFIGQEGREVSGGEDDLIGGEDDLMGGEDDLIGGDEDDLIGGENQQEPMTMEDDEL